MAIVIEKNVPRESDSTRSQLMRAIGAMKQGDSFLVGEINEPSIRTAASAVGAKVSIRNDAGGNRRCWRTA